jgi:hypothetical protein
MSRLIAALGFLLAFAGAAHWVVPMGRQALAYATARDDAARIADLELDEVLTEQRVAGEIESALAANDAELAQSFIALADARGIPVAATQRARTMVAAGTASKALNNAGRFGRGFLTGRADDLAGLAGATAGDLTVWGDLRDAGREAIHWAKGENVDELILGLSAVGIAATTATYATFGASLPVRAGLSALKGARRAGVLGLRLADDLAGLLRRGAKGPALRLVRDIGTVQGKAGTRATLLGIRHVDDAAGAARLRRLAEVKGGQTLAIVKTLGRGALYVTKAFAKLAWWILAAVVNLFGLIASFNSAVVEMVRPLWRRKSAAASILGQGSALLPV